MNAIKLPVRAYQQHGKFWAVKDNDGDRIAHDLSECQANEIVKRINAHDDLMCELKRLLDCVDAEDQASIHKIFDEPEILPPKAEVKLLEYAATIGLEKQSTDTLVEAFRPIFDKARKALQSAAGVAASVKDATCVREIEKSRACRLELRAVKLKSDETRKKHKKHALLYGRAVDGFHNILMADLIPVETALQESEDVAETRTNFNFPAQRRD